MEESDPNKSRALESSLWEIQLLKNHVLPIISNASKSIISTPLPNVEWDLSNYLELKENDVSIFLPMMYYNYANFLFYF